MHYLCLSATPMSNYLDWNLNGTVLEMVERLRFLPLANKSQPLLPNNSQTVRMIRPSNYTENMEHAFDVSRRCMFNEEIQQLTLGLVNGPANRQSPPKPQLCKKCNCCCDGSSVASIFCMILCMAINTA